jgi:integrase
MLETSTPKIKKEKRKAKDIKKAGNGQGSVRELPNGKWRWEVTLGYTLEGKRQSVSGVCANQTQAGIEKAKALADFARGLLGASETVTLCDYTERWLERQRDIRASSKRSYKLDLGVVTN